MANLIEEYIISKLNPVKEKKAIQSYAFIFKELIELYQHNSQVEGYNFVNDML